MASSLHPSAVRTVLLVQLPPPSSAVARSAAPAAVSLRAAARKARSGTVLVAAAAVDNMRPSIDEYPEGILSGEWPENFSLLSYADLRTYLESQIVTSDKMSPKAKLGDVMSRPAASLGQRLAEIDAFFATQSGLPVVDGEGRCIGVIQEGQGQSHQWGASSAKGLEDPAPWTEIQRWLP